MCIICLSDREADVTAVSICSLVVSGKCMQYSNASSPTCSGLSNDQTTSMERTAGGGSCTGAIAAPGCCAFSAAWCRCTFGGTPMSTAAAEHPETCVALQGIVSQMSCSACRHDTPLPEGLACARHAAEAWHIMLLKHSKHHAACPQTGCACHATSRACFCIRVQGLTRSQRTAIPTPGSMLTCLNGAADEAAAIVKVVAGSRLCTSSKDARSFRDGSARESSS